jgi:hypothetical protein
MLRLYKMPRLPTDYSRTIIYKIVKNDDFENANVYVGSTTEFVKRKYGHKSNCNNENNEKYNRKVYQTIRENGGWENWNMIEIEKYPCNDKREAETREEYWRCELKAKLNSQRAFITTEQLKQHKKEYRKEYCIENSDKIKQFQKEYHIENADKIKEKKKEYRTENAEKIKQFQKQYRTENAEKIYQKYDCECGGKYTHQGKSIHFKTKNHQNYINNKN